MVEFKAHGIVIVDGEMKHKTQLQRICSGCGAPAIGYSTKWGVCKYCRDEMRFLFWYIENNLDKK